MPQNDMPKGCDRLRLNTVMDTPVNNKATPQSMCTSTSGAPSCAPDKASTYGGAMVMKVAGSMRCGHSPTLPMRTSTKVSATGQSTAAMPYCAAAHTG